jgi:hypothetical protein
MAGGTNGPPVLDGTAYSFPNKTLLQLRTAIIQRLGYSAQSAVPPPGMADLVDSFLQSAQTFMYERYSSLRIKRWWPIALQQGERHYDVPSISTGSLTDLAFDDNDPNPDTITRTAGDFLADGFQVGQTVTVSGSSNNDAVQAVIESITDKVMTFEAEYELTDEAAGTATVITTVGHTSLQYTKIEQAWIQDDTRWFPLRYGIPPYRFNETGETCPDSYVFRQNFEFWPPPDKAYTAWFYGHIGLKPFAAEADTATINPELILLFALANAKAHYRQPDSGSIFRQAEVYLGRLISNSHGDQRYVPRGASERGGSARDSIPEPVATFRP